MSAADIDGEAAPETGSTRMAMVPPVNRIPIDIQIVQGPTGSTVQGSWCIASLKNVQILQCAPSVKEHDGLVRGFEAFKEAAAGG